MQKIQKIEVVIQVGQTEVMIEDNLAINYSKFTGIGIMLEGQGKELIMERTTFNGKELLPKDSESELILSSINVAPDNRFFTINEKSYNSPIEMTFKAPDNLGRKFVVYLRLEK